VATKEQKALKETMDSVLNTFLKVVDADLDVYLTIPEFAAIQFSGHTPGLANFIKNFGGFFMG